MPINEKYTAVFEFDKTYHICNKTNNSELLFRSDENYYYFLRQFTLYISPIADTYAWNLQPNHFHFLIRIKPEIEILQWIEALKKRTKTEQHFLQDKYMNTLVEMTSKDFSRLMQWRLIKCTTEPATCSTELLNE